MQHQKAAALTLYAAVMICQLVWMIIAVPRPNGFSISSSAPEEAAAKSPGL